MSILSRETHFSQNTVSICSVWKSDMKISLNGALVGALGAPIPPFCMKNRSGSNGTAPRPPTHIYIYIYVRRLAQHNFFRHCGPNTVLRELKRSQVSLLRHFRFRFLVHEQAAKIVIVVAINIQEIVVVVPENKDWFAHSSTQGPSADRSVLILHTA